MNYNSLTEIQNGILIGIIVAAVLATKTFFSRRYRRSQQAKQIRGIIVTQISKILNPESFTIRSTEVGEIGKRRPISGSELDEARYRSYQHMLLQLDIALSHHSSELSFDMKESIYHFLKTNRPFIEAYINKKQSWPTKEIYTEAVIGVLKKIEWLKIRPENHPH